MPRLLSPTDKQRLVVCLRQITKLHFKLPLDLGTTTKELADKIYDATPQQRQTIIESITAQSLISSKKEKKAASASWKLKVHTMTEKGAAAAHSYIKKPKGMDKHIIKDGLPQVGQQAVQALEDQWRPLWQAPGRRGAPQGAPHLSAPERQHKAQQ